MPNLYVLDNPKASSGLRSDTRCAVVSAESQAQTRKTLAAVADDSETSFSPADRWLDPDRTRCWFLGKTEMPAKTIVCHERFG